MPRYPEHFIQQVQQATDIVDLVSSYIAIKQKGREYLGLCPFHDDSNPSLTVSPAKQLFKCFACGAGGGVYQWMMLYDKLTFPEAVTALAERANIPLPAQGGPDRGEGPSRTDLRAALDFATRFFRKQLSAPQGTQALQYARERGLTDETLETWSVGYAPDAWDGLIQAARRAGITQKQLVDAGLATRRESGGAYDRFRNRLILPIRDVTGKVIAFGGRALSAEERAKYLNSPESPLFNKSRQLYGLDQARQHIVNADQAVVVEGYFDVIQPHQAGLRNVVATLGTSLTDGHVRILSRYARQVVLIFDADEAGSAAAMRGLELFLRQRVDVRVASIADGKDPCDFVQARGAEALRELIAEAPDALSYVWRLRSRSLTPQTPPAVRQREVDAFLELVAGSESYGAIDEVQRGQLSQHIAHLLNTPAQDVQMRLRRLGRRVRRAPRRQEADAPGPTLEALPHDATHLAQRQILEVLISSPELFDTADERISPDDFTHPQLQRIARLVWIEGARHRLSLEQLLAREELNDLGGLLADLAQAGELRANYEPTLHGAVECLLYRNGRREIEQLKSAATGDDDLLRRLHSRFRQPDVRKRPRIL